ncbi:type II toxin-antitoxin system PemK/MazF family toxin [Sporomusa acidovorans]|uniref:type II toxin-antitoxin system PemK/MazF family toxin n=1 Tax=Sporomusa acidovorans TaxID=112900 RepID=UPI003CCB8165
MEENKHRPVVIVRSHPSSPICQVIPLTNQRLNDRKNYHIDLEVIDSTVLIEQLRVIDRSRIDKPRYIGGKVAVLTKRDWENIDSVLSWFYRLKPLK